MRYKEYYRYLVALIALYITLQITATTLSYKLILIGPFLLKGGSLVFPLSYIVGDIITEIYGYKVSRQLIWGSIACGYIFAGLSTAIIYLPSPDFWHGQEAFIQVLGRTLRFTIAGSAGSCVGSFINVYMISKTKIYMNGKYFWIRSFLASALGETIQSTIVFPLAFAGILSPSKIFAMIYTALLFKLAYSLLAIIPANYFVTALKRKTKIDIYDFDTKFTPFKLGL